MFMKFKIILKTKNEDDLIDIVSNNTDFLGLKN